MVLSRRTHALTLLRPFCGHLHPDNFVQVALGLNLTCDALRDLVPSVQLKKNVENTHGVVLILVKLWAFSLQLYLK